MTQSSAPISEVLAFVRGEGWTVRKDGDKYRVRARHCWQWQYDSKHRWVRVKHPPITFVFTKSELYNFAGYEL